MKKSGHYLQHRILKQLDIWMDWLETPNKDFGGMPVCPFLAPERKTNKLLIDFYDYREKSLFQHIIEFDIKKEYTTALFLHVIGGQELKTTEYQEWVTRELETIGLGHLKAVCFSPFEKVKRNGIRTREKAPCFITSITTHEALNSAWKKIKDSHYWKKNK